MAAATGFLTATPDSSHGDTDTSRAANYAWAQKFTAGGSGNIELLEIGGYFADIGTSANCALAVFTHDAVNNCPETLVANSQSSITTTGGSLIKLYATYGTRPQLTGGNTYWLVSLFNLGGWQRAYATGGTSVYRTATHPTMPTGAEWESHTDNARDASIYVVYQAAAATAQYGRPSSDVADGNWLNELANNTNLYESINETSASDSDYIRSGTSPDNDTCTVGLSSMGTPGPGTVTMRIRARFL